MVLMCEEEVLDWMRTRTAHPCSNADPDPAGGLTGQKLVEDLEKTITKEEATQDPLPGSKEDTWMMEVLRQATKVLCLVEEACNTAHPRRAGHARSRSGQPSRGPTRCGKAVPGAFVDFVTYPPEWQTGQPGAWCQ
jgi:hypothetical protein